MGVRVFFASIKRSTTTKGSPAISIPSLVSIFLVLWLGNVARSLPGRPNPFDSIAPETETEGAILSLGCRTRLFSWQRWARHSLGHIVLARWGLNTFTSHCAGTDEELARHTGQLSV